MSSSAPARSCQHAAVRHADGSSGREGDPLRALLRAAHLLTADRLPDAVLAAGRLLDAAETVTYLADYEQTQLLPVLGGGVPARQPLSVDATVAGLAFRRWR